MIGALQQLVRSIDAAVARAYLRLFKERNALICFLFHSLFRDEQEMERNLIDPLDRTTVSAFRQLVAYYLEHGYRFITPDDLLSGLDPDGKYAMLTFDDGYFNNVLARPVLEEFDVPAVFFISTDHVRQNKCFWWDVLYRELVRRGATAAEVYREALALKPLQTEAIEARLSERFGPDCHKPVGDIDRPFTETELREFSTSPLVHLGNHSANHAILTNYSPAQTRDQIARGQEALREITGKVPLSIAYPNGAYDEPVLGACAELGLKIGFTIQPQKCVLPLDMQPTAMLQLGRFVPHSKASIRSQCQTFRSDLQLYALFRSGYLRLTRANFAR